MLRPRLARLIHSSVPRRALFDPKNVERAEDDVDVCIVGGGPAGLSAAIRLKQLERDRGNEIRVVVLEKGSEAGAHIVSGAVIEPRALNELLPDWTQLPDHPLTTPATSSSMRFFTEKFSIPIPHPPQMSNNGNYIVSLSAFTRWLASVAENEYGIEIYPGFAAAQLLYSKEKDSTDPWGSPAESVRGVITNEVGLTKGFIPKSSFEPGMAFNAKVTLLAEGAHGSLSKLAIQKYKLRKESQLQTYGIGVKEVWRVDSTKHEPGKVVHTLGWPLDMKTYGGGFVYHMADGLVSLGLVIGLDYPNPYLSPYRELQVSIFYNPNKPSPNMIQRMKHHPYYRDLLMGAERLAYGARTLNEGGLQSVPKLNFPGGALIGCSAGFVNIAKIKGTHNAMKSGMLAAEAAYDAMQTTEEGQAADLTKYNEDLRKSWIWEDLHEVRNLRPSFNTGLGVWGGIVYSGIDSLLFRGRVPWTFKHAATEEMERVKESGGSLDATHTERARLHKPIEYPPFESPLSTDLMTSVALTGTNHAEDQPVHLRVVKTHDLAREIENGEVERAETGEVLDDGKVNRKRGRREHVQINMEEYAGLLGRACPAGVYEYVKAEEGDKAAEEEGWKGIKLLINSQVGFVFLPNEMG
ncbi:putative electron transfer flavoprotein-ubiquinone oxidoreductase, mitochondrial [Termitomyces sp. J132]|nr:putative electron transfer flavoprotein-ubiquinone oxidoreductase, mitochondrial [Termitomyces sp. J132]